MTGFITLHSNPTNNYHAGHEVVFGREFFSRAWARHMTGITLKRWQGLLQPGISLVLRMQNTLVDASIAANTLTDILEAHQVTGYPTWSRGRLPSRH